MLIKVKKSWLSDGTIVLEAFDKHYQELVSTGALQVNTSKTAYMQMAARAARNTRPILQRIGLPRGTPKEAVRLAAQSLKMLAEVQVDNKQGTKI